MQAPGPRALYCAGVVSLGLGVFVEAREAVSALLVGFGSTALILAVVLPRLVGSLKVGASGLEGQLLASVEKEADELGLSKDEKDSAVEDAKKGMEELWADWMEERLQDVRGHGHRPVGRSDAIRRLAMQYVARHHDNDDP